MTVALATMMIAGQALAEPPLGRVFGGGALTIENIRPLGNSINSIRVYVSTPTPARVVCLLVGTDRRILDQASTYTDDVVDERHVSQLVFISVPEEGAEVHCQAQRPRRSTRRL